MSLRNWRKAAVASRSVLRSNFPEVNAECPRRTGARTDSTISHSSVERTLAIINRKAFEPASIAAKWMGLDSLSATGRPTQRMAGNEFVECRDRSEEHTSELQSLRHLVC